MGKNKKTRWRRLEDEAAANGAGEDIKVNGTNDSHPSANSHAKYSQILGDHHTNNFTTQLSNKSTSSTTSSSQHLYKGRSFNNKENFFNNQRGALRNGLKSGWHRSNSSISSFRATAFSSKDRRPDENGTGASNGSAGDDGKNPIKFNEDEYTRITTPRQDVLFKKGYLTRMNSKTANSTLSMALCNENGAESTAPNSTATNSDPESSVSTLSPATTPSMDFAQQDSMEYAPMYYQQGFYDENGMFVIPMFNNPYNYYSPNGSVTNSPVILMPYPYPYDPFFMAPNTEVPLSTATETDQTTNDGDDEDGHENEKAESAESDGAKENNQHAEEQRPSESKDEKHEEQQLSENAAAATSEIDGAEQKQNFPVYANELCYVYPAPVNGYYNGFYYNGMPGSRQPKPKTRRKRVLSSRSSTSHPPRSAETTTDYSDDDNSSQNHHHHHKRNHFATSRHHHNGWTFPHNNGYNQYHYYSKYSYNNNKYHYQSSVDQNASQAMSTSDATPQELPESNLNVDVQEFYPRVQPDSSSNQKSKEQQPESKCDAKADLEQPKGAKGSKASQQQPQVQQSLPPPLPVRATKKEIMEGTKSMEQQNINLNQCKSIAAPMIQSQDVEWKIIGKKKVKVVLEESEEQVTPTKKDASPEAVSVKTQDSINAEVITKKAAAATSAKPSAKKAKGKNKKKKPQHMMTKQQNGFEIIEPQFGNASKGDEINAGSGDEEETVIEDTFEDESTETIASEHIVEKLELLIVNEKPCEKVASEAKTEVILQKLISNFEDDGAVIDISDEEICCKTSIELNLAEIAQEIIENEKTVAAVQEDLMCSITQQVSEVMKDLTPIPEVEVESVKEEPEITPIQLNLPIVIESNEESCPSGPATPTFDDINFFGDHKNIAELERDLIENLRNMDDGIDIKSPLINPLYDFPITTAVSKWLQEKQNESFDCLFHVQNFKKLSELYDECDDESDISESPNKSETTDSDYGSDCQVKANGSPTSSKSAGKNEKKILKGTSNKLKIVKESFCALM